jgi:hypothetical protein
MIWDVGLHEPSELLKKLLQFGAARAGELNVFDPRAIVPSVIQTRRWRWMFGMFQVSPERPYRSNVTVGIFYARFRGFCERRGAGSGKISSTFQESIL